MVGIIPIDSENIYLTDKNRLFKNCIKRPSLDIILFYKVLMIEKYFIFEGDTDEGRFQPHLYYLTVRVS